MAIKEFLVQPVVRTVAIRTAKNIVVLGAAAQGELTLGRVVNSVSENPIVAE